MKTAVTDSASAAEEVLSTPSSLDEAVETGFLPDDAHYRLTGEFKEKSADTEEASAASETTEQSEEVSAPSGEKDDAETAAASAAADTQEKKGKSSASSESRWAKLSRENREIREENARLKGLAEGRQGAETSRDGKQASLPANAETNAQAHPEPKIDDKDSAGQPKYKSWEDYQRALRAWDREEAVREVQASSAKTQREQEAQRSESAIVEGFRKKLETARPKHADFDKVALNPDLVIPRGSVADGFLLESEHAGEVLYYLGQHPEILEGFYGNFDKNTGKFVNKITPFAQARALTKIELELSGDSSAASRTSSAKPITQAPRPPHQVSGQGTVAKDASEQAVEDNDFETFRLNENAKAISRQKRK